MTLLSACTAIRPSLLRHLRHRLPADLADAGSEAAAWQHPAFVPGDFALLPGDPAEVERLRRAFPETGDAEQRRLAWDLIRAQQGQAATRAVCMEERVLWDAMQGRTDPEAEAFLDRVADALGQAGESEDPEHARFLAAWVNRRSRRMHPDAWKHSPSSEALWLLANPRAEEEPAPLPPGYDIHRALAAAGRPERPRSLRLVQHGEWLEIEPLSEPESPFATGSPVVGRLVTRRPVVQLREQRPGVAALSLPLGEGAGLPLNETGWWLRTDDEELLVEPVARPDWAHTQGRDRDGLFVGFDDEYGERRAYWCPPLDWLHWPGSPGLSAAASPWSRHGCFIDADQFNALRSLGLVPPYVGASLTSDGYGLRAEVDIKGIAIGFRWIWPDPFLMGSPQTEAGRDDDERQHQVILTRGFWLAETACTQALWETVMGENPSAGKGGQRPVNSVSWEDVNRFLERLNAAARVGLASAGRGAAAGEGAVGLKPDLQFRLPTEAEWEYACRAGTTTAYAFGDAFDPKLANNGSGTVDVRSLPPNPWGLYEMHGNVWEWCLDRFGNYPAGPVVDPVGAASGERRVLRGGSWIDGARLLRSAYRDHRGPGYRDGNFGFRLALGPELGQAGDGRPARSGAGLPAQGASGSEREARGVGPRGRARGKGS